MAVSSPYANTGSVSMAGLCRSGDDMEATFRQRQGGGAGGSRGQAQASGGGWRASVDGSVVRTRSRASGPWLVVASMRIRIGKEIIKCYDIETYFLRGSVLKLDV